MGRFRKKKWWNYEGEITLMALFGMRAIWLKTAAVFNLGVLNT